MPKPIIKTVIIKTKDILDDYQVDIDNFEVTTNLEADKQSKENLKKTMEDTLDKRFEEFFSILFLICNQVRHTELKEIAEAESAYEEARHIWKKKRYLKSFFEEKLNENKFKIELDEDTIAYAIKYINQGITNSKIFGEGNERAFSGIWFKKHLDSLHNAQVKIEELKLVK